MNDIVNYTFKLDDLTPETMPFGRLLDYYSQIAKMLGAADKLRFSGGLNSNHGARFAIERTQNNYIMQRIETINAGTAPRSALRAHDKINAMLKEDGTSALFFDTQNRNVIKFLGIDSENKNAEQIKIRGRATFTGELYHITGKNDGAKIRIHTNLYGSVLGTLSKDMAKKLRNHLFEYVRVSGRGLWIREQDGRWRIENFIITDFITVSNENLRSVINKLRAIDIDWPKDMLEDA